MGATTEQLMKASGKGTTMKRISRQGVIGLALFGLLAWTVAPPRTAAQTEVEWKEAEDGLFNDGDNWVGDAMPAAGERAVFDQDGAYTVFFADNATTGRVHARDGDVIFDLGAGSPPVGGWTYTAEPWIGTAPGENARLTVSNGALAWSGNISIGADGSHDGRDPAGTGTVHVTDGGRLVGSGVGRFYIGMGSGGMGTLIVAGAGSEVTTTGRTLIGGDNGAGGTLQILSGGTFTLQAGRTDVYFRSATGAAGSEGLVAVSGDGSLLTIENLATGVSFGERRKGITTVADGGRIAVERDVTFATLAGSESYTTVSGISSTSQESRFDVQGTLEVGRRGYAELTVADGGVIKADAVDMGFDTVAGEGRVIVKAGGLLDITGGAVGSSGAGEARLRVEDGGQVKADSLTLRSANNAGLIIQLGAHDPSHVMIELTGERHLEGAAFQLELGNDFVFGLNDVYTILSYDSVHANDTGFLGLPTGQTHVVTADQNSVTYAFELNYADSGNFVTLTAIPEPGTLALFGAAALSLLALRRRGR